MILPQVTVAGSIGGNLTLNAALTLPQVTVAAVTNPNIVVDVDITAPGMFMSNNYLTLVGSGGVIASGSPTIFTHNVELDWTGSGGVQVGGHSDLFYGGHLYYTGDGGAVVSGAAEMSFTQAYETTGGVKIGGAAEMDTFSPVILATIDARLTKPSSHIVIKDNIAASIKARLPLITAELAGGMYAIEAGLPLIEANITAHTGVAARIGAKLPAIRAAVSAKVGNIARIRTSLPLIEASLSGTTSLIAEIDAQLPKMRVAIHAFNGAAGRIHAPLTRINAALKAGYGAVGTIQARLPKIAAALEILAQATTQELVLVVGTHTSAVTTYEQYPFNSFFEMNGKYYAAGDDGLCQIDVGDDDMGNPISAGFGTGMMSMGDEHQKHILSAYMTLRTAGDLNMTITVDEGAHVEPCELTLSAQDYVDFIQRRLIVSKGLRGKTWQFEINNVDGCDFDFGQLGLNIAHSARRI